MSEFLIRAPRPEDAAALAEIHLHSWAETYADQFPPSAWGNEARARRMAQWTAICAGERTELRVAVAESGGELIGFAGVGPSTDEPPPRDRQLWFIYLLKQSHGSGAAQALLDEVLGDEPASLWVLEGNPRATAFYVKNGFAEDGTRKPTSYADSGDELRMVR